MKNLAEIQSAVKAKKSNYNSFGKYHYRNKESILEVVKPLVNPHGWFIKVDDDLVMIGNRYYIKSTATLSNGKETYTACGWAREAEVKKGMDDSQITGSASSYAGKMALQNLLALDDGGLDPDGTNDHGVTEKPNNDVLVSAIKACDTEEKLYALYSANKKAVEESTDLRKLFTQQKLSFK
jgi:hypothetical protein